MLPDSGVSLVPGGFSIGLIQPTPEFLIMYLQPYEFNISD
jgi:hypothetical protein